MAEDHYITHLSARIQWLSIVIPHGYRLQELPQTPEVNIGILSYATAAGVDDDNCRYLRANLRVDEGMFVVTVCILLDDERAASESGCLEGGFARQ